MNGIFKPLLPVIGCASPPFTDHPVRLNIFMHGIDPVSVRVSIGTSPFRKAAGISGTKASVENDTLADGVMQIYGNGFTALLKGMPGEE